MADELLPCPFCGSRFVVATSKDSGFFVLCNEGDCHMDVATYDHPTRAEAVALWNTRANSNAFTAGEQAGLRRASETEQLLKDLAEFPFSGLMDEHAPLSIRMSSVGVLRHMASRAAAILAEAGEKEYDFPPHLK